MRYIASPTLFMMITRSAWPASVPCPQAIGFSGDKRKIIYYFSRLHLDFT